MNVLLTSMLNSTMIISHNVKFIRIFMNRVVEWFMVNINNI